MNIGDIADMAGVSRAAVSRYLNHGYVSKEKCERIRRVIEETGYQPSPMAQTLRTKKTKLIGVVLPRINSDSISSIVEGISAVLHQAGYDMLLALTENCPEKELDFLRIFSRDRVDGVILIATVFSKEHIEILEEMSIPVVIVGQRLPGFSCIYHDDFSAAKVLTRHVLSRGRKRIGYIGALMEDAAVGRGRCKGFLKAMEDAGLAVPKEDLLIAGFSVRSGREKAAELLAADPGIDAVICATDSIALGAMQCICERNLKIPEDIALAGFGDNLLASVTTPGITTIHFQYRRSGEEAADRILLLLGSKDAGAEETRLSFELVVRGSA